MFGTCLNVICCTIMCAWISTIIIFLTIFVVYLLLLIQYVIFVLSDKQPLSATNFLYELDKITQEIVTVSCFQTACIFTDMYHCQVLKQVVGGEGGGVWGLLLKTLNLFMTKICYIPYPIYDLIKTNSIPYLWPDPYIKILFQTCVLIN